MAKSSNRKIQNKLQLALVISLAVVGVVGASYMAYNELYKSSSAAVGEVKISNYRPETIVEGETESILLNGENFDERCIVYLGEEQLEHTFMNSESLEAFLPDEFDSDIITLKCPGDETAIKINVSPDLEQLPE